MIGLALGAGAVLLLAKGSAKDPLLEAAKTGNALLDRLAPIVVAAAKKHLGKDATSANVRALMAILNNESGGNPRMYLGDKNLPGGPSIGPMQVYRSTALDMRLWTPPTGEAADSAKAKSAYAALAVNEQRGIDMGVAVFAAKLKAAKGNTTLAIRKYNGAGPAAETYKTKALDFVRRTWA